MSGRWATSTRRATLPPGWSTTRKAIRARDSDACQWPTGASIGVIHAASAGDLAQLQTLTGICGQPGSSVDHRREPNDHSPANLWTLCATHHTAKTQAEAAAARPRERRDAEPHPGLI